MARVDETDLNIPEGWMLGLSVHEEKNRIIEAQKKRETELAQRAEQNNLLKKQVDLERLKYLIAKKRNQLIDLMYKKIGKHEGKKFCHEVEKQIDYTDNQSMRKSLQYLASVVKKNI